MRRSKCEKRTHAYARIVGNVVSPSASDDKPMNYLVTGGAGYIGGTVSRLLLERGHRVTVYDNLCHSKPEALPLAATFVEGDIADANLLSHTLREGKFDGVLHF